MTIHVDTKYYNFAVHYVLTMAADVEVNFIDDTTGTMKWIPSIPEFVKGGTYEINILKGVGIWMELEE